MQGTYPGNFCLSLVFKKINFLLLSQHELYGCFRTLMQLGNNTDGVTLGLSPGCWWPGHRTHGDRQVASLRPCGLVSGKVLLGVETRHWVCFRASPPGLIPDNPCPVARSCPCLLRGHDSCRLSASYTLITIPAKASKQAL